MGAIHSVFRKSVFEEDRRSPKGEVCPFLSFCYKEAIV